MHYLNFLDKDKFATSLFMDINKIDDSEDMKQTDPCDVEVEEKQEEEIEEADNDDYASQF